VVADEVHNTGASGFEIFLTRVDAPARLGLSATPGRFGDPTGTDRILSYFGLELEPTYSLADALRDGVLTPYWYDYSSAILTAEEQGQYDKLTTRIRQMSAGRDSVAGEIPEALRFLLIRRARIVKEAQAKPGIALDLVRENWREGDRWLIYCANQGQLRSAKHALESLALTPVIEYHQAMPGSAPETISFFHDRPGILLAIKCLDEGVNIPAVNKAVILASSTNPREYVQRRGRLLRVAPHKRSSHIWDCMVRDMTGHIISEGELMRGIEFARLSQSPATVLRLESEAREGGYDLVEFEEDEAPPGED
jgi:superfamily II DNA or RNA helicase